jgi:hypothetical protein
MLDRSAQRACMITTDAVSSIENGQLIKNRLFSI